MDAAGRQADSGHDESPQHDRGRGQARRAAGGAADQAVRDRRTGRLACPLPVLGSRRADHRGQPFHRWRLDGGMTAAASDPAPSGRPKKINLALQGGGAHGAFTWGVLDYLLEDGRLAIEGLSGTSAGALNAVILIDGLARGGPRQARKRLADFWRAVSIDGELPLIQRQIVERLFTFMPLEARRYRPGSTPCR